MGWASILALVTKYGGPVLTVAKELLGIGGSSPTEAEQKGQADQKVVDQNAALDASRRMNTAAADPAGREVTQGRLDDGIF